MLPKYIYLSLIVTLLFSAEAVSCSDPATYFKPIGDIKHKYSADLYAGFGEYLQKNYRLYSKMLIHDNPTNINVRISEGTDEKIKIEFSKVDKNDELQDIDFIVEEPIRFVEGKLSVLKKIASFKLDNKISKISFTIKEPRHSARSDIYVVEKVHDGSGHRFLNILTKSVRWDRCSTYIFAETEEKAKAYKECDRARVISQMYGDIYYREIRSKQDCVNYYKFLDGGVL